MTESDARSEGVSRRFKLLLALIGLLLFGLFVWVTLAAPGSTPL